VWEEFGEPADRMIRNAGEDVFEPREGIDTHPLAGSDKATQQRSCAAALVAAKEDPIVATDGDTPDRTLRGVIVNLEISVFTVAGQSCPILQGVAHIPPCGTLGQYFHMDVLQIVK
jgi:hypothetical protein